MGSILSSVGRGGVNRPDDVRAIQSLLNANLGRLAPLRPVSVSGSCDPQTILLIEEFQRRVMHVAHPDGRVDLGGKTLKMLTGEVAAAPSVGDPVLEGLALPGPAAKVLKEIMREAGVSKAKVTSVSRTPAEQARVMYENCVSKGAQFNKNMYAAAGDSVVAVYEANQSKSKDVVIELMRKRIVEVGPGKVSKHISDTHYTFDVAPSSIPAVKHAEFQKAVKAHKAVSKLIPPPTDPAFHIEIPKSSPHL